MNERATPAAPATGLVLGINGTVVGSSVTGKTTAVEVAGHGTVQIPNRVINLLQAWEGPLAFCSSWGTDATRAFLPVFGKTTVLPVEATDTMWWKAQSVLTWISQTTQTGTLLWADDELEDHADDVAAAVTNAAGQGVELIPMTTKGAGLNDDHLRLILAHAHR
ncbi:hypothetical protein [Kocuria sp. CH-021]|uniref:hypothetical protein n=1 Tax=Kocuria sp. CH-021 TaxID=3406735 RepID=UPI003C73C1EA